MTRRPQRLLWTQSPAPYADAIIAAGLSDRVVIHTLSPGAKPFAYQMGARFLDGKPLREVVDRKLGH